MYWNTWMHVLGVVGGLLFGTLVIFLPKSGKTHRMFGLAYLFSMLAVNIAALTMYRDSGGEIGAFHILAMISLITLALAYGEIMFKVNKGWMIRHAMFMNWSYVGLVAAGVARYATHLMPLNPGLASALGSILSSVVGGVLIFTLVPRTTENMKGPNKRLNRARRSPSAQSAAK